jgi:glycosyltransferase involved in cell wall biosynthesis
VLEAALLSPVISVVIPGYGRVEPLKYTLKSAARALREAGGGGEIVVVDDGSEPPLEGQLQGFEAGHPVRFLRQKNQGSIVARMTGLAAAQEKFVLFLDSDDLIHPEKIRAQTEVMEESGAEVSYSDMAEAQLGKNHETEGFRPGAQVEPTENSVELFTRIQPLPHGPMYRREYLARALAKPLVKPNRAMDPSGDVWLYRNLLMHPAKVRKVDGPYTAIGPHEETRYSQCWEKLGTASLLIDEEFFRACPRTPETEPARRVVGEVAFVSWRTLPYDVDREYRKRKLKIWRQAPKGNPEKLGGKGFQMLAKFLGPVAAGWVLRRWLRPKYEACRTLGEGETIGELIGDRR